MPALFFFVVSFLAFPGLRPAGRLFVHELQVGALQQLLRPGVFFHRIQARRPRGNYPGLLYCWQSLVRSSLTDNARVRQRLLSQFVRAQQSAFQLLASMSVIMSLHHSFRHENRALHRIVFQARIIRLLDQHPEVRNCLLSGLLRTATLAKLTLAIRIRSGSLLRVAACNACS